MSSQSSLAKVKGLGSAKSGTKHFIHQRVSAIFMIPLTFWFIYSVLAFVILPMENIPNFVTSPVTAIMSLMFVGTFLYHGTLGMRVIFEDYMHCKVLLNTSLILLYAVSIVSFVAGVVSIFSIHFIFRIVA